MANSAVYSSIMATIFASLNVLVTRLVAFDTSIADLTPYLNNDPVELLFTLQLGGGTDIAQAVEYGAGLVERPEKCILVLIQVQGSKPYTVRIEFHNGAPKAKCTCPAARFSKFCKHAIAVLIMWAQSPDRFIYGQQTLAEEPPTTKPRGAKRATKATVERSDLQTQSIQQTLKLAQELAERGLTGVQPAFLEQLRTIAENLQSLKTHRLKQAVDHLAQIIETAREFAVSEEQFTRALLRLWLTTRAVEEHFAQRRTLPQEQLEEMLGRTWRDTDLQPRENLRLMELAYENIVIQTGFRLDISHLIELNTGELLREMKITPLSAPPAAQGMKPARPKPFLATRVGVHPGYAPKRIKIYDALPLHDELATLVPQTLAHAHTEWRSLISHYLERLLDPFAPRELPCLLHYQHIVWQDNTLWLADTQGMLLQLYVMPAHLETLREAERQDQQIQQEHPGMIRAESDVHSSVCWEHALLRHRWLALFGYLEGEDRLWFRPIGGLHEHGVAPLIFQLQRR